MTPAPDLPPRQRLVAAGKWPVVGESACLPYEPPWRLSLAVEGEPVASWTLDELQAMRNETAVVDFHCVTRWSRTGVRVTGISLESLLMNYCPSILSTGSNSRQGCRDENADSPRFREPRGTCSKPGEVDFRHEGENRWAAKVVEIRQPVEFVSWVARTERRHSSSIPLADAIAFCAMLVWEVDGVPLAPEHGGPLRSVVPGRYFYKSVKWVERIDLLVSDRLGYWEAVAGYHNGADPWNEERYVAGGLSREQLRDLLASRDWSEREVLSLVAEGRDLAGLVAKRAVLRNANFRGAKLAGADFSGANLSNACFAAAILQGADFRGADVEGAEFDGANLSGADFRGASLFGATFSGAIVDRATRFDRRRLEALAESERVYLSEALQRAGAADDETDEDRPSV